MVEVAPKVPSSLLGQSPSPVVHHFPGSLIHEIHVVPVVELGPFGFRAKVSLAELIACIKINQIESSNWYGDLNDSSSPALIIPSIQYCERSVLNSDIVEGSVELLGVSDTDKRKRFITKLISFERVAVITRESTCPATLIGGEFGGLHSESSLDRFQVEEGVLS